MYVRLIIALLIALTATAAARSEPTTMLEPAQHRQLLIDDHAIERMEGLTRSVHAATKHPGNPVLRREHPWEGFRVMLWGTVLFDEATNRFRMWYCCVPHDSAEPAVKIDGKNRIPWVTLTAYAESEDGVRWQKPHLQQHDFNGSRDNNLVNIGRDNIEGLSVLHDPNDPDPTRRYKAIFWEHRSYRADHYGVPPYEDPPEGNWSAGIWAAFSPDGIEWRNHGCVIAGFSDTHQTTVYDPKIDRYVLFNRLGGVGRRTARSESADLLHWSSAKLVLAADDNDPPGTEIYAMPVLIYEGMYLGLPLMFYHGTDARIEAQLAASRDGKRWQRVGDRTPVIGNGAVGQWDAGDIRMGNSVVVKDNTIYLYYAASAGAHAVPPGTEPDHEFFQKYRSMHIGLATLRRDGWVSLDAGDETGWVLTRPFVMPKGALHLNVDATGGEARVVLAGQTSKPVEGDQRDATVQFDDTDAANLTGQTVQFRIHLRNAKLYSFWFE